MLKKIFKDIKTDFWATNGLDLPFLVIVILVLAVGLVLQLSAGAPFAYSQEGDSFSYIKRQAVFAAVGLVFMYIVSRVNYDKLKYFSALAYGVILVLLVYTALGGGDINRWITIGPISFQPSEPAKLALIMFLAFSLGKSRDKLLDSTSCERGFINKINKAVLSKINLEISKSAITTVFYLVIIALYVVLILVGSHLSGAILIMLLGLSMLWMSECKCRWFVLIGVVGVIGVIGLVEYSEMWFEYVVEKEEDMPFTIPFIKDYMCQRVVAWTNKDYPDTDVRWQINNSLAALGSGGLLGTGIGNSKQKYLYVAECHTDFIFSIIGEELGFVGCLLVIALFGLLIWRGIHIALRIKNRAAALLVFGIMAQIGIQVVFNIAVITDTVPNTGIPLPFFSYGGTALVIALVEMGIVLSVSRYADLKNVYVFKKSKKKHK